MTVDFVMCGSVSKPVLLVGSKDHLPSSCPGTVPCPGVQCSLMRMRWFSSARLSSLAAIISPGWPVAILPLWKLVSCEDLLGEVRPDHVVLFPDLSHCLAPGHLLSLDQHLVDSVVVHPRYVLTVALAWDPLFPSGPRPRSPRRTPHHHRQRLCSARPRLSSSW